MNNNNHENFTTSDLALAATVSLWYPLQSVEHKLGTTRAIFVFIASHEVDGIVEKYWKRELAVEPRQYFDQLKAIKSRLYADQ